MTEEAGKLHFAVPDGHLMVHVLPFLAGAGIELEGYQKEALNRRPTMRLRSDRAQELIKRPDLVAVKVIRPQDMPTHVATSNFDLAISGTDWFKEHVYRFPSSPVVACLPMAFGKVRIVAAVHQDHENDIASYFRSFRSKHKKQFFRIATEYVYIANQYAQQHNLNPYKIIMTYGATESMIPEDCDMIVENTETGNTLKKNRLKEIDVIMQSEGYLIANRESLESKKELVNGITRKDLMEGIQTLFKEYLQKDRT